MFTEMSWNKLILTGTANAILRFQFSNASESCSNSFGSHVHGIFCSCSSLSLQSFCLQAYRLKIYQIV
jgi:hypothetical protein